jgi:hypothetical protein
MTTSLPKLMSALVYLIILGLDRLQTASLLHSHGTFLYLTGLPNYSSPQSLRRFLLQAALDFREQLHPVNDYLLQLRRRCLNRAASTANSLGCYAIGEDETTISSLKAVLACGPRLGNKASRIKGVQLRRRALAARLPIASHIGSLRNGDCNRRRTNESCS